MSGFRQILGPAPGQCDGRVITFQCDDLDEIPDPVRQALDRRAAAARADYAILPAACRFADYRLLAFDMDSTLITTESINELATLAQAAPDVARMTEAAIQGNAKDYAGSMRARVRMLKGIHRAAIAGLLGDRLRLTPGAMELVATARSAGLHTVIVSGGFQIVANAVRQVLDIDEAVAHELEFDNDVLTGEISGPVIDATGKARILEAICARLRISRDQVMAVGDGANDLGMAAFAGLFAGFKPKAALRNACAVVLDHHGLDGLLLAVDTPRRQAI